MSNDFLFTDTPTIDNDVADPLKKLLGDSYLELVGDFTSDFPVKFKNLQLAANQDDVDSLFKISHTLKSSSGSFGFTRLYKRLEFLELQARKNQLTNPIEQVKLIKKAFDEVLLKIDKE